MAAGTAQADMAASWAGLASTAAEWEGWADTGAACTALARIPGGRADTREHTEGMAVDTALVGGGTGLGMFELMLDAETKKCKLLC